MGLLGCDFSRLIAYWNINIEERASPDLHLWGLV